MCQFMVNVFRGVMNALCAERPDTLLAKSYDGARNMTGRVHGIVSAVGEVVADAGFSLVGF